VLPLEQGARPWRIYCCGLCCWLPGRLQGRLNAANGSRWPLGKRANRLGFPIMSAAGGSAKSESAQGGGAVARGATAEKGDSQSVLSLLQARELGVGRQTLGARRRTSVTSPQKFSRSVRGSAALVSRLELEAVHEWHDGCVNTISFTPSGTALISGSDDRHIVVGDWQTVRMLRKSDARTNSTPVAMPVLTLARARRRRNWCAPGGR